MANGATIWARKTIDSEIFYNKPDKWFKIWFYIVNTVNHKEHQSFNRSEGYMTNDQICAATKATIDQTKKCLCYLRKMGMIRTTRSTRGFAIKVLAYNKYQDLNLYKSTAPGTRKAPEKHQRSTTINKNEKNEKNEKNIYIELLDYFNSLTGKKYRMTQAKATMVKARLKTFTPEDIKKAIRLRLNDPNAMGKNASGKIWAYDWNSLFRNDENMDRALNLKGSFLKDEKFYIEELKLGMAAFVKKHGDEKFAQYSEFI